MGFNGESEKKLMSPPPPPPPPFFDTPVELSNGGNGHSRICIRGHWRAEEDAKLRSLVAQYGPQNWNFIAEKLEGRSGKSCRLRWCNQLDPRINRRVFGEEEEERLVVVHRMYGNKWALLARLFPGRTDNAVKNHWHVMMARKNREKNQGYMRRRTSPYPITSPTLRNASSGDSTITSVRDESGASTCTDLSLISNSQNPRLFQLPTGPHLKLGSSGHGCEKNFTNHDQHNTNLVMVLGGGPSGSSDSNSEASGTESASNNINKSLVCEQTRQDGDKVVSVPFFDFLGVGHT